MNPPGVQADEPGSSAGIERHGNARPPVTVLLDPTDEATVTRTLLEAHDPPNGVVTVHPTPGLRAGVSLATDTMQALGRPVARMSTERISGPVTAWHAAAAWIHAEGIGHLVVLRGHQLSTRQHRNLLELRRSTGVHLVLVWHTRTPAPRSRVPLEQVPHRITDNLADLVQRLAERRRHRGIAAATPGPADTHRLPPVPDEDVTEFRAEAFRRLAPEDFARVDAVYTHGLRVTCRWLSDRTDGECLHRAAQDFDPRWVGRENDQLADRLPDVLREPHPRLRWLHDTRDVAEMRRWQATLGLSRLLGAVVADSLARRHTVARLRGAQAGLLLHGMWLDLPANLAYAVGPGLTTTAVNRDIVDRIRARIASPIHAAALVTALFTGATVRELNAVPASVLTDEAIIFTSARCHQAPDDLRVFVIPPAARPLLRAAQLFRQLHSDPPSSLFAGGIGGSGQRLRASAQACGLILPARHDWPQTWIRHTGVSHHMPLPGPGRDTDLLFALNLVDRPARDLARPSSSAVS